MEVDQHASGCLRKRGFPTVSLRLAGLLLLAGNLTACGPAVQTSSNSATTSGASGSSANTPAGSAMLSWNAPTENIDGTPVTDLAGYHVHFGTSAAALTETIDVSGAASTNYVVNGLSSGTYYFAVSAYNSLGFEGAFSNIVTKTL